MNTPETYEVRTQRAITQATDGLTGRRPRRAARTKLMAGIALVAVRAAAAECPVSWRPPVGDGFDRPVAQLITFNDGSGPALFVGGAFTTAGGQPVGGVARWDGATWESLRGGFDAPVQHLVVFDDDGPGPRPLSLFAGGPFTAGGSVPLDHFARWNGSAWEAVPGWSGGWAMAAAAYDADDEGPEPAEWYVAGNFTSAGDEPAAHLARRTATGWTGLDEGADGPAHALAVFNPDGVGGNPGLLYAAGAFNYVGSQTEEAGHIARWGPPLPCLRTQPVTQVVVAGAKTSFSVDVDGTEPFQFQWYHDGLALSDNARISGARGPILTIAGVSATDAGRYNVRVANACGYALSVSAELAGSGARRGDLNCDGRVDFDDVDPFVLALSAPEQYAVQYPGCGAPAAD